MGDIRNWPKKFLSEFISLYKSHTCLWNPADRYYYDRKVREEAYNELIALLGNISHNPTKALCLSKLGSMKCYFRREYLKFKSSQKNGGPTYKPTLWYFNELLFLKDINREKFKRKQKVKTNADTETQEDLDSLANVDCNQMEWHDDGYSTTSTNNDVFNTNDLNQNEEEASNKEFYDMIQDQEEPPDFITDLELDMFENCDDSSVHSSEREYEALEELLSQQQNYMINNTQMNADYCSNATINENRLKNENIHRYEHELRNVKTLSPLNQDNIINNADGNDALAKYISFKLSKIPNRELRCVVEKLLLDILFHAEINNISKHTLITLSN